MKFSIITPTYNRANIIERAINSLQNQTYDNWEMIIVDDGSTDNTEEIVKKYLQKDNRIKYIKLQKNSGVGKARNVGLRNVSKDSNWIGFLDSDDIFVKNALELVKQKIKEYPDFKHFAFSVQYKNGKKACSIPYDNFVGNYETVLGKDNLVDGEFNTFLHSSLIKRGFCFEESVNGYEWIAWLRLAKNGVKILYTTTITRIYINEGESLLRPKNKDKKFYENAIKGIEIILREFGSDLKRVNLQKYALYLYSLGYFNICIGNKKKGFNLTLKAFRANKNLRFLRNIMRLFFD